MSIMILSQTAPKINPIFDISLARGTAKGLDWTYKAFEPEPREEEEEDDG